MSYDLSKIEELVQFDEECSRAANECPQVRGRTCRPLTSYPLSDVSVAGVFCHWFGNSTLWQSGYCDDLSEMAKSTFRRYARFRDGRVYDSATGTFFSKKDTFRVTKNPVASYMKPLPQPQVKGDAK
jgi:hypothetical protein